MLSTCKPCHFCSGSDSLHGRFWQFPMCRYTTLHVINPRKVNLFWRTWKKTLRVKTPLTAVCNTLQPENLLLRMCVEVRLGFRVPGLGLRALLVRGVSTMWIAIFWQCRIEHWLGTAPLRNSWIISIIGLYIALINWTSNMDCYWVGAVPKALSMSFNPQPESCHVWLRRSGLQTRQSGGASIFFSILPINPQYNPYNIPCLQSSHNVP